MKNTTTILSTLFLLALSFSACQTDNTYPIPTTYNFSNVDYSGQTTRLEKLEEIVAYIKTAHVSGATALNAAKIKDMYAINTGNHYSTTTLNAASSKQLKNKMIPAEQSTFEIYLDSVAVASQFTSMTASNGQAGIATNNAGNKSYLLNANGIELAQIIEKGIIGACFYYQATELYMGPSQMNVDNTTINSNGTAMEHAWDEAFGYFGAPNNFPTNSVDAVYWAKYCNVLDPTYPLNAKMMDAFLKGRAAISAKDLPTRDAMIVELRKNWELITVGTAIYYLNDAKAHLGVDNAAAYHELSEVFAFIMCLKYGEGTSGITDNQVDTILNDLFGSANPLQASTYTVDVAKIEAAKTALVTYFTDLASVKDTL